MSRAADISLEELLDQAPWLRRLAATLVAGDAAAEDLVQETWLAALQHPPKRVAPLRPWLAQVARNLALNFRRGEARRSEHEAESSRTPVDLDPLAIAGEVEAQRVLAEAVLRLEEPLRTTVVLRYFRGLDSSEIGRLQRTPAGTVRWRLKRGLELLRADLDARFGGERRTWLLALASLAQSARDAASPPLAGAGSTLTTGAALMSASTKVGVAVAAALAVLFTAWIVVGGEGGAPKSLVASDDEPHDLFAQEEPVEIASVLESSSEPHTREALAPSSSSAEIALAECCIVGRILDGEGRGLPGALVEARAVRLGRSALRARHAPREAPRETRSAADGSFSLAVPALRSFVLSASHTGFAPAASVPAFAGERRDIVLAVGGELVVHVSEERAAGESAPPCVGAKVEARMAIPRSDELLWKGEGRTDASGTVAFTGVPAGAASVVGSTEERLASARAATDGETRTLCELELRATGRLEGTVVDRASELPIEGARVGLGFGVETTTDRSGRYVLELIPLGAGVLSLGARARGFSPSYEYVVVDEGRERQTVDFQLEPALRAIGTVLDRSGRAVAGARVAWTGALATAAFVGETDRGGVATDAHGRFELEELHPDTPYRLLVFSVNHATGVFACGPFAAPAAGALPIELGAFTLDAGGSIAGDVPDARSLGEAHFVQLYWAGDDAVDRSLSHLETVCTDPRGRFAFEGLAEGRYRLELWKSADPEWSETPLTEAIVVLSAGEERGDVVLEATSGQTIRGRVVVESGEPFRQCMVRLFALPSPEIELGSTYTDEDGRFRFQVHGPGPFRVLAEDTGLIFDSSAIEPVGVGDELAFVLREFRSEHVIRGVLLTESGVIPRDVFVSFTDSLTKQRLGRVAIPGLDGRFEMKNLRALPYDLETVDFANGFEIARIAGVRPGPDDVELHLKPRE